MEIDKYIYNIYIYIYTYMYVVAINTQKEKVLQWFISYNPAIIRFQGCARIQKHAPTGGNREHQAHIQ